MSKIEIINEYIEKCMDIISAKDVIQAQRFQDEIIGVFGSEIPNITSNLDNYVGFYGQSRAVNYIGDADLLKAKLINYKSNIEMEEKRQADDLEKLRLQQSILTINNNNSNNSSSIASASSTVTISIQQVLENIYKLSDATLSKEEKEVLEEKLSAIEVAKNTKDNAKLSSKIGSVLKYITDKGIEVGIAVLPYLGEISKLIQN